MRSVCFGVGVLVGICGVVATAQAEGVAVPAAAAKIPAPFDAQTYAPTTPLPAGVYQAHIEDRDGVRWWCKNPPFDRAKCSTSRDGLLAKWYRDGDARSGLSLNVEVFVLPPLAARSDSEWAKQLWNQRHDPAQWKLAQLRVWRVASGRVAESDVQWQGPEQDPVWGLARYVERDGFVLSVRLQVAGRPGRALRDELRRVFVDGPLGPAPPESPLPSGAAAFSNCESVEVTGAPPAESICKRPRKLASADHCCTDPVEVAVLHGAQVLLRVDACGFVPPECTHSHGHGRMASQLHVLSGPPPEVIVVEGGCESRALMHGYVPSGVAAWTGCPHLRYRWDGKTLVKQPTN